MLEKFKSSQELATIVWHDISFLFITGDTHLKHQVGLYLVSQTFLFYFLITLPRSSNLKYIILS